MQSPPASTLPRFTGAPSHLLSVSRGREGSARRAHIAACVTGGVATFLFAYAAFQLAGAITGWHPPPLVGTTPPIPLFWRMEVAGLLGVGSIALVLPACWLDVDRTRRWIDHSLRVAIAAISVVAVLFP